MTRDQEERDTVTVEIGYAVVSAALLAGAVWLVLMSPVLLFGVEGSAAKAVAGTATTLSAVALVWRAAVVLWGFDPRRRTGGAGRGLRAVPGSRGRPARNMTSGPPKGQTDTGR
ncbi:hypothetical protein IQ279_03620 [Streptomyces verrucosisporus]|uniref:DUF6332 family protein n=1 Tax=Streptomyces verrucosisporus TaxID=1695161 RepID=UPI0019D23080|nr:DUF6332 family protein [Streptomyces verrucosisporus]MBN3928739.1 hypothetical protein [Streptomyces verrucosisporus]